MNYLNKDLKEFKNLALENSLKYINAAPFPHIIIDDLFNDKFLDKILKDFPSNIEDIGTKSINSYSCFFLCWQMLDVMISDI